jgi:hypothetical protein
MMVRLCGVTIPRWHNIATPCRHERAASQHFAVVELQSHNAAILQWHDVSMSSHFGTTMLQRYVSATLCCRAIAAFRRHTIPPS